MSPAKLHHFVSASMSLNHRAGLHSQFQVKWVEYHRLPSKFAIAVGHRAVTHLKSLIILRSNIVSTLGYTNLIHICRLKHLIWYISYKECFVMTKSAAN